MHALIWMLALAHAFSLSLAAPYFPEEPLLKSISRRDQTDNGVTWYKTEPFYAPDLQVKKTNETAPGLLFFTPYGAASTTDVSITNSSVIMTDAVELVWMSPVSNYYSDLRTQSYNNQTYLTFWNSSIGGAYRGSGYGSVDFLDHSLNFAHRVCLADLNIVTPTGTKWPCQIDLHEAQMTNRNTLLVTVYNVTQADLRSVNGSENGWIFDSQFYKLIQAQSGPFSHGSSPITSASFHLTSLTILSTSLHIPWASFRLIHGTHSISTRSKAWTMATLSPLAITGQSTRFSATVQ